MFELICFLNFGYPSIESSLEFVQLYYDCGCRAIQLDIPSKNPYLEQDEIKQRMKHALISEPNYQKYFDAIYALTQKYLDVKFYLSIYSNTIEDIGIDNVIKEYKRSGIKYAGIVGSTYDIQSKFEKEGISVSFYVQKHLPIDEVVKAKAANRISYQFKELPGQSINNDIHSYKEGVDFLREQGCKGKIYATVGIKTPKDIEEVKNAGAQGAFIGSALMKVLNDPNKLKSVLTAFVKAADS